MLSRNRLHELYIQDKQSVSQVAQLLGCSQGQVNYWLAKYGIAKRTISDAIYAKWNPAGDPFEYRSPTSVSGAILFGIGVGLYWGEGTKSNKTAIRLGNTDPRLVSTFILFLTESCGVDKRDLRFGLQVFSDMNPGSARQYWAKALKVPISQFHKKIIVTPHRGVGNYRKKTQHGVLTVYFNNRKLRDIICRAIDEMAELYH